MFNASFLDWVLILGCFADVLELWTKEVKLRMLLLGMLGHALEACLKVWPTVSQSNLNTKDVNLLAIHSQLGGYDIVRSGNGVMYLQPRFQPGVNASSIGLLGVLARDVSHNADLGFFEIVWTHLPFVLLQEWDHTFNPLERGNTVVVKALNIEGTSKAALVLVGSPLNGRSIHKPLQLGWSKVPHIVQGVPLSFCITILV